MVESCAPSSGTRRAAAPRLNPSQVLHAPRPMSPGALELVLPEEARRAGRPRRVGGASEARGRSRAHARPRPARQVRRPPARGGLAPSARPGAAPQAEAARARAPVRRRRSARARVTSGGSLPPGPVRAAGRRCSRSARCCPWSGCAAAALAGGPQRRRQDGRAAGDRAPQLVDGGERVGWRRGCRCGPCSATTAPSSARWRRCATARLEPAGAPLYDEAVEAAGGRPGGVAVKPRAGARDARGRRGRARADAAGRDRGGEPPGDARRSRPRVPARPAGVDPARRSVLRELKGVHDPPTRAHLRDGARGRRR